MKREYWIALSQSSILCFLDTPMILLKTSSLSRCYCPWYLISHVGVFDRGSPWQDVEDNWVHWLYEQLLVIIWLSKMSFSPLRWPHPQISDFDSGRTGGNSIKELMTTRDHPDSLTSVLVTDFMTTTVLATGKLKWSLNKENDFCNGTDRRTEWQGSF